MLPFTTLKMAREKNERHSSRASFFALWLFFLALVSVFVATPASAKSADDGFREEEVRFESGRTTISGTVLEPEEDSPHRKPAMVLVHGSGAGSKELYRQQAEVLAREGMVILIYDKRTKGYSQFERSYELLADDALAALRVLRSRSEVDPNAVGIWGISEGGWVAPIAAARSEEVAFIVLVGASGVPPAQQQSWNLENRLRQQGISGSMVRAISRTGTRMLVGAGLFPEANHDPVVPLEGVRQPVLAIWGSAERVSPPAESARTTRETLRRMGNLELTVRFFPGVGHTLHSSPDGMFTGEELPPGYPGTVASWVEDVSDDETQGANSEAPPPQERLSRPLAPLAWWESGWAQLGATALPILAFASYPVAGFTSTLARLVRRRERVDVSHPLWRVRRLAWLLSGAGLVTMLGFICYFGFLTVTTASAIGPMIAGRTLPWLTLQALAVGTVISAVVLAASWWVAREEVGGASRVRVGVLLVGGVVFVVWAAYWGLLVP